MSFASRIESRTKSRPVNLFLFRYGPETDQFYAYTNAEFQITHLGVEYAPIPIDRDAIDSSGTLDKKSINVMVPLDNEIATMFITTPPGYGVTLIIRAGHTNDPTEEFLVEWSGRVLSCTRDDTTASFSCEPVSTSMRRSGLRRHWQYSCPLALYGSECNANKAAATTTETVVLLTAASITLNDGWQPEVRALAALGGIVQWETDTGTVIRTIIEVVDLKTLKLNGPTNGLSLGDSVEVSLGCNHRFEFDTDTSQFVDTDCFTIHDNLQNYGGDPWIPLDNPIGTAINKYF